MSGVHGVERRRGTLEVWNDERGFGFIAPATGGQRVFVHISAFARGNRPVVGREVTYADAHDEQHRARAVDVRFATAVGHSRGSGIPSAFAVTALFFALLAGLWVLDEVPGTVLAAYGLVSGIAFMVYGADKAAAIQGRWRASESTLHLLGLLGGWPGALVARPVFRHKTIKQPFRAIFWATVLVNCLGLGSLMLWL
ncbi:hypothetical protein ASG74_02260 [Knoellia sp. Soil729]|nr:hypothetical protein ASG74_02260 [Knoellia sp. Soil729]